MPDRCTDPNPHPSLDVVKVGLSQFAEFMAIDPAKFVGIQYMPQSKVLWILLERADGDTSRPTD